MYLQLLSVYDIYVSLSGCRNYCLFFTFFTLNLRPKNFESGANAQWPSLYATAPIGYLEVYEAVNF